MSYSIDQFSKITGINKLLLRTWENRYNFLKPARTESKIRYYSDELLIKALNAKLLVDNGYKISLVSKKTDNEIEGLLNELIKHKDEDSFCNICVNNFVKAALKFDTLIFNETYFNASQKYKAIEFYKKIMLPTFKKIGLFWLTNKMNPAQEHFLSEMFKQKIYSQINAESEKKGNNTSRMEWGSSARAARELFSRKVVFMNSAKPPVTVMNTMEVTRARRGPRGERRRRAADAGGERGRGLRRRRRGAARHPGGDRREAGRRRAAAPPLRERGLRARRREF